MSTRNQTIGRWGEEQAVVYLTGKGYAVLDTNVRTPYGEIDLIALNGDQVVFVEVKTRTSRKYGFPEDSVTPRKQSHMLAAAGYYLEMNSRYEHWQYDVVSVERLSNGQIEFHHFENVLA